MCEKPLCVRLPSGGKGDDWLHHCALPLLVDESSQAFKTGSGSFTVYSEEAVGGTKDEKEEHSTISKFKLELMLPLRTDELPHDVCKAVVRLGVLMAKDYEHSGTGKKPTQRVVACVCH